MTRKAWLAKFRGFVFFSGFFALLSLLPLLLLPHFEVTVFHNERPASFWGVFFVWSVGGMMFWAVAPIVSGFYILFLSLVIGGASANLLYRIFLGPVPDYIPLPFDVYGNLSDLMIIGGGFLFLIVLARVMLQNRKAAF